MTIKKPKNPYYFLILFKVEGHSTWRAHITQEEKTFARQVLNDKVLVTDKKIIKIDRVTGEIAS